MSQAIHESPRARVHVIYIAALLCIAGLVAALSAAPAEAQAPADSCRASAARSVTASVVTSEPAVANPAGSPCASDARRPANADPVGPLSVSEPYAETRRANGVIAATASIESGQATLGASAISVGAVTASQYASCTNGLSTPAGSSRVDALVVAGTPVDLIADRPFDQTIGGVRIRANQVDGGTRRALILDSAGSQLVLGEPAASGDACRTITDGEPAAQICPSGATYDVSRNVCVIREPGAPGGTVVVGRTYQGPSGGTVITLREARLRANAGTLPKSPCLRGAGPKYVVVGTNRADKLTGTNRADRILALAGNDAVDGGRGRDCLDGNRGRDHPSGGLGNDRLYGGSGRDAITGGLGSDRLYGGSGDDSLNTGFGRDYANAGPGNDWVNSASSGRPAKRLLGGKGRRDRVWFNPNERHRHRGFEIVHSYR